MAAATQESLSDEDWLVSRARACMKTDQYAAKAWMITARTLFPQNFGIQFEAYNLEKIGKNVKEAAKLLEEMFVAFPNESRLWQEVQTILGALQADAADIKNTFLTDVFAAVSTQCQCQMLLKVAGKITGSLEQCRLMLLAMRKFPNIVEEHGLKLVEKLQKAEKDAKFTTVVNCYRKLLVYDVMPLVIQRIKVTDNMQKQVFRWLQLAVEFYVMFITQATLPTSPDLLSPTKGGKRFVLIPGLQDRECLVQDPWGNLLKLMVQIGNLFSWSLDKDLFLMSREQQWQYILNIFSRSKQSPMYSKQVLYVTTVLFLECLYTYVSNVDPEMFIGAATNKFPLVLLEGMSLTEESSSPKAKKSKTSGVCAQIVAPSTLEDSNRVIQSFLTGFKCFELLHSKQELQREFMGLCQAWRMETWTWMAHFQTDMLLYQGAYADAASHLQTYTCAVSSNIKKRNMLQMACCYHALGNFSKACHLVLEVIKSLDKSELALAPGEITEEISGRHLILTQCSKGELLPYCIQILLSSLKESALGQKNDMAIGHMMVLMQYDWPKHGQLFNETVLAIKNKGSLAYNLFFTYIINIDMLEEFAFLKAHTSISLDILPISSKLLAQHRTVTRGVNKGVKEDFKQTIEKQTSRCQEELEPLLLSFLTEECEAIFSCVHVRE